MYAGFENNGCQSHILQMLGAGGAFINVTLYSCLKLEELLKFGLEVTEIHVEPNPIHLFL